MTNGDFTDPTFQSFPIEELRLLVQRDPSFARRDKRRTRALLKDEFPEYALQVELLSAAVDLEIPLSLEAAERRNTLSIEAGRLAQTLVRRFAFQEYMARWAVAAWAFSLSYLDEDAVSSTLVLAAQAQEDIRSSEVTADEAHAKLEDASPMVAERAEQPAAEGQPLVPTGVAALQSQPTTGKRTPHSRFAIFGGIVAVILVISVIGIGMAKALGPQASPTPTPTPVPTATSTPTVIPTLNPVAVKSQDRSRISTLGYVPAKHIPAFAFTPDGSGGTLYGWTATCRGSGDGYCQKVFFFDGTRLLGTDTKGNSAAIDSVESAGPRVIDVTYANYKPSDALCCPSGVPVTISYTWSGQSFKASGTPPGH
jgi:hypothetical protein